MVTSAGEGEVGFRHGLLSLQAELNLVGVGVFLVQIVGVGSGNHGNAVLLPQFQ